MNAHGFVRAFVVTYESDEMACRCVESLLKAGVAEVIVRDNASPSGVDGLSDVAARFDNVVLQTAATNSGFGEAVNFAVQSVVGAQPGDCVWIVNPDTIVDPNSMNELVAAAQSGAAEILSPVITTGEDADQRVWFSGGHIDVRTGQTQPWVHEVAPGEVRESGFICGASMFMTVETWNELGGFRPDLFMYWEDAEFSLRASAQGNRLGVVGSARVWHKVGGSQGGDGKSALYFYYMARNRLLVCRPDGGRLGLLAVVGLRYTLRLLRSALRERDERWVKSMAVVRGSLAGLR